MAFLNANHAPVLWSSFVRITNTVLSSAHKDFCRQDFIKEYHRIRELCKEISLCIWIHKLSSSIKVILSGLLSVAFES